ncbi:hypothetical protein BC830DRAFT_1107641 [Chytriomyces sp. MP71]|nr:hypothetical protein BC830DRAFT_1107641 [Chytriomyces sp. MP71]
MAANTGDDAHVKPRRSSSASALSSAHPQRAQAPAPRHEDILRHLVPKEEDTTRWEEAPIKRENAEDISFLDRLKRHRHQQLQQACTNEEVIKTTNFRDRSHGGPNQFGSTPRFNDMRDPAIECFSGLRITERRVYNSDFLTLMQGRTYIPLSAITPQLSDADIGGDWVTIGVLVDKSEPRTAANQKKYMVLKLSDLRGSMVNMLMFGHVFETYCREIVGGVFAVLNPRILPSTEKSSAVGIDVDDQGKFLKLGESMDQVKCKFMSKSKEPKGCYTIIDGRKTKYCTYHMEMLFKKAKLNRAEFASGTSTARIGSPTKTKRRNPVDVGHGSYLHNDGMIISTLKTSNTFFSRVDADGRVTIPQELSAEALNDTSRGAKYVRIARGLQQLKPVADAAPVFNSEALKPVFNSEALKRLGFDPISGKDVIVAGNSAAVAGKAKSAPVTPSKVALNDRMIRACVARGVEIPKQAFGGVDEIEIDI